MTNKSLSDLLYAPQVTFNEIPQKVQGVWISVQGKVKMVMLIFININYEYNMNVSIDEIICRESFNYKILTNINLRF